MLIKNPSLLEKRLNSKEKESDQKAVVAISGVMFLSGFIVAGLDYRFGWLHIPDLVVIVSSVMFLFSYFLYAEVMRENTYLSRGIVRHPMYSSTLLMFLSMPHILGSFFHF